MVAPSARAVQMQLAGGGLRAALNANGSLRRLEHGEVVLNLFVGNELEGGPANLYLRRRGASIEPVELLGPRSMTRWSAASTDREAVGVGEWSGLRWTLTLMLAESAPAWFWHLQVQNTTSAVVEIDLVYAQDVALAPYGAVRTNEYYVSQYVDHTPLRHSARGYVIASRQNQAVSGRTPWCVIGSLRRAVSYATDALQWHGLSARAGDAPALVRADLPGRRLQHEHSMVCVQDAPLRLEAGASGSAGFFGRMVSDHPAASGDGDLARVDETVALREASPQAVLSVEQVSSPASTLFSKGRLLSAHDLTDRELNALFPGERRHEERDSERRLLSFFYGADRHVALRAKELRVLRPHGHLLRTGTHPMPDERVLTSTVWMGGVFNSMLTQGHVSINRALSTTRSYLSLFRSHGQRVFAQIEGQWTLLDVPSAFDIGPERCRWLYRHAAGLIEIRSEVGSEGHVLALSIDVREGEATRFLVSNHVALNGDDGSEPGPAQWHREGRRIVIRPAPQSGIGRRFPQGSFEWIADEATPIERVAGDEALFEDGQSRSLPYVCIVVASTKHAAFDIRGRLIDDGPDVPAADASRQSPVLLPSLAIEARQGQLTAQVQGIADIVPWFVHNAFIHYLSPRGLEQYSGGGWGTRDVSQGPVELLLATGHTDPVRDLLLRVFRAQSVSGDWPQWFMFFERERDIRAGDSHGDIVFWPLLALAQYLIASGDAGVLEARTEFYERGEPGSTPPTVWEHVERALALIERRVIGGTVLAAYGHGDWNDALQPADPSMREYMCSAWTVTLHYQMLTTLARAMRLVGREAEADRFEVWARAVRDDFQRVLMADGVLTGYALFTDGEVKFLLHPRDTASGVRYSALAMVHAILEDLFTPTQAREHLQIIERHLSGPEGLRLFDRPMAYHGGPQRFFQRAESATFFGREIGLMYMHAHLRYVQALAHVGEAERFFSALCQANPIGIRGIVPRATLRQANCYYSSSDAAFHDRYEASEQYARAIRGEIDLEGGWRVYSSGAGIGLGLIVRRFLGLSIEAGVLSVDPVMPPALDGLRVGATLFGCPVTIVYEVRAPGCGVSGVQINDDDLPLAFENNPHRRGAARILKSALVERLEPTGNVLRISVG
jgi:cellobiose phosphorylase